MEDIKTTDVYYNKFIKYLTTYIKRDGIDKFIEWINTTDASVAPASTKYHMSEVGGLIKHSLNVFFRLIKIINMEYPNQDDCPYSKESLALVSLLHDISKVNFYEISTRNVKNQDTGEWSTVPYFSCRPDDKRLVFAYHEENSLYILQHFFKLTYDEAMAIRWHSGSCSSNDYRNTGESMTAFRHSKLALYLHMADMMACLIDENSDIECNNIDFFNDFIYSEENDDEQVADGTTPEAEETSF